MDESNKSYREYKLIEGINLLVNMVDTIQEEKNTLKQIHDAWIETGFLNFADQIEVIWGTAADYKTSRYLAHCINELNSYIMSKYPNHRGLMRNMTVDILNALNMAVHANAHIWSQAQLQSIQAAFMSGHVAKTTPYPVPPKPKPEKKKKRRALSYNPSK